MQNKTMTLKVVRCGNLAPGDVHERCTDCEVHHEANLADKNEEGYVLLKGSKEATAAAANLLYQFVQLVPINQEGAQ